MSGLCTQFRRQDQRAACLVVGDLLPHSAEFNTKTQGTQYNRSADLAAFAKMEAALQKAVDSPEEGRPLSWNWEEDRAALQALGVPMKRTSGRGKVYIEKMFRVTAAGFVQSHRDRNPDDDIADVLLKLFNWLDGLQFWPRVGNADLDTLYEGTLKSLVDHYCVVPADFEGSPLLSEEQLRTEWSLFRSHYISAARAAAPRLLQEKNARDKVKIDRENTFRRKGDDVAFVPRNALDVEDMLQYLQGKTDLFRDFPVAKMLASTLQTAMFSQARVESMFNYLKLIMPPLRSTLKADKFDMLMMIKLNGPTSEAGKATGLTHEWLMETAFKIFQTKEVHRKIDVVQRRHVVVNDLPDLKPRADFGRGPHTTKAAADIIEARLAKAAAAQRRKEEAAQIASGAAQDQLDELDEDRTRLLAGPASQVELVVDSAGTFIRCLGATGVELRQPLLDIDTKLPQPADEVAVTGFAGNIWFVGTVLTALRKGNKMLYKVYFDNDNTMSDCKLLESRYGPAKVEPGYAGGPAKVTAGWMFIHPKADGVAPATHSGLDDGGASTHEAGVVGGGAATRSALTRELRNLVFSCNCGSLVTTAKLLAARVFSVEDLGMLSKKDLKDDLKMTTGDAGRLIQALEAQQQTELDTTPG
jgi:hypothetical protein